MPDHPAHSRFWNLDPAKRTQHKPLLEDELLSRLLSPLDSLSPNEQDEQYPVLLGFYNRLLAADVLLPVLSNPSDVSQTGNSRLVSVYNASGEMGIAAFTSEQTLTLWHAGDEDCRRQSFMSVCQTALTLKVDFLLINVAGPYGCQISTDDLSYLANGLLPPPADLFSRPSSRNAAYTVHSTRYSQRV